MLCYCSCHIVLRDSIRFGWLERRISTLMDNRNIVSRIRYNAGSRLLTHSQSFQHHQQHNSTQESSRRKSCDIYTRGKKGRLTYFRHCPTKSLQKRFYLARRSNSSVHLELLIDLLLHTSPLSTSFRLSRTLREQAILIAARAGRS